MWGGINDWLADGVLNGRGNGKTSALIAEKLSPTGESEGAEGRLVTLTEPIEMKELERRVKKHLGISQRQSCISHDSVVLITPRRSSSGICWRSQEYQHGRHMCWFRRIYASRTTS